MSRVFLPLLFLCSLVAQSPLDLFEKAPPDVDQTLRDRIAKFYQAHVDGKFRAADAYVAEDTKDFYYEAAKPRYLSFAIDKIVYSENFTKAKATILCEQRIMLPGFGDKPMKIPTPSNWKLVEGQWFWYVDRAALNETPFGRMKPGEGSGSGGGIPSFGSLPDQQSLLTQIKVDKSSVELKAENHYTDQVTISSQLPGTVSLSLEYFKAPGFDVALDRTQLKAGEQATVTFRRDAKKGPSGEARVQVVIQPTNQSLPIRVIVR